MIEMNWSTPLPETAQPLTYVERLVLHALRQWVADKARWCEVVLEFNRTCGPHAATRICDALDGAFRTLGRHARRRVRLHRPVCCLVSHDELCVLNLLAARQTGAASHAQALMCWLVEDKAANTLARDLDVVAGALLDSGYALVIRSDGHQDPSAEDAPRLRAVR